MNEVQCATCGNTTTDPAEIRGDGAWAAGEDGLHFCPECLADFEDHLSYGAQPNALFREQRLASDAPGDGEGIRRYRVTLSVCVDLAFDDDSPDLALPLASEPFKRIVAENLADWLHLGDLVSPDASAEALTPFIDRIDPEEH